MQRKTREKEKERNSKQEQRKRWKKKAPCQALETLIHGDHLS